MTKAELVKANKRLRKALRAALDQMAMHTSACIVGPSEPRCTCWVEKARRALRTSDDFQLNNDNSEKK